MSKIDQVSHRLTRDTQVVEHLRFMLGGQFGDRFELDNNTPKNVQIGDIAFLEFSTFVKNGQFLLGAKGDASQSQFYLEAFLIDFLQQTAAVFIINFKRRPIS